MGKKVVITDYQYENIDAERRIIGAHGYELYDYQIRDAGALIPVCRDADAIVTQYSDVSAELIDSLEHCAMIIKYGIGVNNIDVEAATRKGIYVCNVPDYGVEEVSDHAVAMMLALSKKLPVLTRALREGDWGYQSTVPLSRFCESTVGLVGFGRIPQLVAKKLKGFGVAIRDKSRSTTVLRSRNCATISISMKDTKVPLRGRITTSFFSARSSRASRMGVREIPSSSLISASFSFSPGFRLRRTMFWDRVANTYCFRDWSFWRGAISNILSAFHLK